MLSASLAPAQPASTSSGQAYPAKPIGILVGFAAGGPSDVGARTIGQKLTEKWGQPVIVDFRPGAAGNIATDMAVKAPADGYTLIAAAFAHAVNPSLYSKLPFNAEKDFAPVLLFAAVANLLVVHPSVLARSVKELIAFTKTKPDQLTIGSAGGGTSSIGSEPLSSTPGKFGAFIQNEMVKWAKVVKAAGIRVE
jgi:tripartite-type tricarboxylate transporter receptor subunit TctC